MREIECKCKQNSDGPKKASKKVSKPLKNKPFKNWDTYNKFFWSDTYLILAEEEFDNIFYDIYEEKITNCIFE